MRPTGRETHQDAAGTGEDFGGHFDQPAAPGAGLAFAQWVVLAAAVEKAFARAVGQCLGGKRIGDAQRTRCRRFRRRAAQTSQQVQRGGVQVQSEEVGQEAMIAQAVGAQTPFEFLVAVLALAAFGVFVVGRGRQQRGPLTIGDDLAAIGALRVRFALDDDLSRSGPRRRLIGLRQKQTLLLAGGFVLLNRLSQ